ncbi:uncharacterized protein DDB_G0287625-like isoform X2 [Condylostylus longicornis]|nr:uncharacterized protein DDB_G0287625-like isoform X2 [Condylostylus longicornis]
MANYFVKLNDSEETYIPAEISICKFSIRDGILDKFHTFVNPGVLPFGHALQAREHAKSTHQLELPPNAVGEKNLGKIYKNIAEFINPQNEDNRKNIDQNILPPVYTDTKSVRVIKSILKFCKNDCFDENIPNIRVYPLQNIFFKMKIAASFIGDTKAPDSIDESNEILYRDNYEYELSLSCKFHENLECGRFCSLSSVTRWSYIFAENICPDLAIKLLPGLHMPSECGYVAKEAKTIEMKPMPIKEQKYKTHRNGEMNHIASPKYDTHNEENGYHETAIKLEVTKIKVEKPDSVCAGTDPKYEYDSDIQSVKSLNKSIVNIDSDSDDGKGITIVDKKLKRTRKDHNDANFEGRKSRRSRSISYSSFNKERHYGKKHNKRKSIGKRQRSRSTERKGKNSRRSNSSLSNERYSKSKSHDKRYIKMKRNSKSRSRSRCKSKSKYNYGYRSRSRDYKKNRLKKYKSRSRSIDYEKVKPRNENYFNKEREISFTRNYDSRSRDNKLRTQRSRTRSSSRSGSRSKLNNYSRHRYSKSRSRSHSKDYRRPELKNDIYFDREIEVPPAPNLTPQLLYDSRKYHYSRNSIPLAYTSPQSGSKSYTTGFEPRSYYSKSFYFDRRHY